MTCRLRKRHQIIVWMIDIKLYSAGRVYMKKNIVLIGPMGVGKSAVANYLKEHKGLAIIDTDEWIEKKEGCSIQEIFSKLGESYFRGLESALLEELNEQNISNTVLSCGGGMVLNPANFHLMNQIGVVVNLTATPETIYRRIKEDKNRPLLKGKLNIEGIRALLEQRQKFSEKVSTIKIETDGKTIEEVSKELLLVSSFTY